MRKLVVKDKGEFFISMGPEREASVGDYFSDYDLFNTEQNRSTQRQAKY